MSSSIPPAVTDTVDSLVDSASQAASVAASTLSSAVASASKTVSSLVTSGEGEEPESKPDETPISPLDAQESVAKHLKTRPDKQDLVDRNIIKDTSVAPSLHAAQAALQRSQLENALEHKLETRPKPHELIREGILMPDEAPPTA